MKQKNDSRERILIAAAELFQTKGFNATGLNEILKESGSPKGSLYYYFPKGKEELALEAIKLSTHNIKGNLKKDMLEYKNPIKAVQAVVNHIIEDLKRDGKPKDISLSLLSLETYSSSEVLKEACRTSFMELQQIYSNKLTQNGISEEDAAFLSMTILTLLEGSITVSLTQKNQEALFNLNKQIDLLLSPYL
ncbi:TetR/AcrR family transcriptional regulator [Clostridium felsineum]|uniref:HTH-type transcriptional regulator YxaF n=1 Tax=Clostridium felsineum TaxID=36839 RepID=A0A1S8LQM5_9CLOT|nr:TetR/AcrR family transcriptional regulator [Clostridium felsineum]URZ08482.1 putative HTH-type transcriptional regulator YxaF [Clostridium felsineum]URZ13513.1 putative HTH-type transcriptional regulator YxaF [Clostridium felsineum]